MWVAPFTKWQSKLWAVDGSVNIYININASFLSSPTLYPFLPTFSNLIKAVSVTVFPYFLCSVMYFRTKCSTILQQKQTLLLILDPFNQIMTIKFQLLTWTLWWRGSWTSHYSFILVGEIRTYTKFTCWIISPLSIHSVVHSWIDEKLVTFSLYYHIFHLIYTTLDTTIKVSWSLIEYVTRYMRQNIILSHDFFLATRRISNLNCLPCWYSSKNF